MLKKVILSVVVIITGQGFYAQDFYGNFENAYLQLQGSTDSFDISGGSQGNHWKTNLEGISQVTSFDFRYNGGLATQRYASIVSDPEGNYATDKAMKFQINDVHTNSNGSISRVQSKLTFKEGHQYISKRTYEFASAVDVYFPSSTFDSLKNYDGSITWLNILELWNDNQTFRVKLNIYKPSTGSYSNKLTFRLKAEKKIGGSFTSIWTKTIYFNRSTNNNDIFEFPTDRWVRITTTAKKFKGSTDKGNISVVLKELTPDGNYSNYQLFNENNVVMSSNNVSDGFNSINPMKLYGSSDIINYLKNECNNTPLELYFDNYAIDINPTALRLSNTNEIDVQKELCSVFPNPSNSSIQVKLENELINEIQVFSISGELVQSEIFSKPFQTIKVDLQKGVYILKIITEDNVYTKQVERL